MTEREELEALRAENARLRQYIKEGEGFLRNIIEPYLTGEVLETILEPYLSGELLETDFENKDGIKIGGERRTVSILFSDLRDSTRMAEEMEPADFITMLNHFFSEMIEIVNAWQGNILDFVGDAIVAVFGAPRVNTCSARDAAACAVAMQRRMEAVNQWNREQGYPEISMGIGMHIGDAILGNIGSHTRMKYDMIGRNVNLASRIQTYTNGGQILVSTEFLEAAGDRIIENEAGFRWVKPKGIQSEILVHDIIGYGTQRIRGQ